MTPPGPELHRPLPLDRVGAAGTSVTVEATEAECAAIAARLRVPALRRLRCRFDVTRGEAGRFQASGELEAVVERTCVVSLDEFDAPVAERFAVVFVPEGEAPEEIDPDELDAPDEVAYAGSAIDLGEAAVEQLALALDPYPRKPGATLPEGEDDAAPNPFAALSRWGKPRG